MRCCFGYLLRSLVLLAVGCGGVTVLDPGGSGGEAATSSGTGGSVAATCGGKQDDSCNFSEWCDYPEEASCGCCDMVGVCVPKPAVCPRDCPGACGCDGAFYCNECLANLAGVDVDPAAVCVAAAEYSVHVLATDVPRFVVFKSDPAHERCFQIRVAMLGGTAPFDVDVTAPWQIESILATNRAQDCKLGASGFPDPPQDQSANAVAAEGTIFIDLPDLPCGVTVDAALHFDPSEAWIPATEPFNSSYLATGIPCDL